MRLNYKSIFAVMAGVTVAAIATLFFLSDKKAIKKNGVIKKIDKVKGLIVKNRNTKSDNRRDIPECFI